MVSAQRKALNKDLSSTDYVDAMDRLARPRRPHVRLAHQEPPEEGTDPHELHDMLTQQEQCDCVAFREEGKAVPCACTQKIMEEEEAEQQAQMYS